MKKIIFLLYICTVFAGCKKNVSLSLPSSADELVINCLYTDKEPIKVYMTKTISPRDTIFNSGIADLIITMNEDGKFKEIISYNQSTGIYEGSTIPSASHKYELLVKRKVNVPAEVTVENTLPQPFVLKNIYFKDSVKHTGVNYYGELRFTIDDAAGADYYKLTVSAFNSGIQRFLPVADLAGGDAVLDDDSTFTDNGARYFSDKNLKNRSHEFIILIPAGTYYTNGRNILLIESASLTNEYFHYIKSLKEYTKVANPRDPLRNPVQLYSNTSNKLGIFAGAIVNRDTIQ